MKYIPNPLVFLYLVIALSFAGQAVPAQDPDDWQEHDAVLVGRISHVEGYLSRFDPETDKWVSTTRESPFGTDDLLRTDADARAEIILPNNTWVRINGDTRIQLSALSAQMTEVDLPIGNGRFYNKSTRTEISTTTPFGRITAPPGAAFDLYVSEHGVDIVAVQESVYFYHNMSDKRHEVRSDSSALFADLQEVTAIAGDGDPGWSEWNQDMDALWAERMATRGQSAAYLPPELQTEAYAMDKHGHWERVYYEGHYYRFWRPVHISAGWSPFSWGAWVVWHGDHVWIPHEPFGYVTHHYGNWIFTAGHWYWAPPVTRVMVRARLPLLHIGFGWYPGRVSWIHYGAHVGWFPLAPYEPYYTRSRWGRRCIATPQWKRHRRHADYKHHQHAVVIHRSHLYRSDNYRYNRIRNISHQTIRNKFRSTPLPDRKVLRDDRNREKQDRFYPNHRRRTTGPSNKIRRGTGYQKYARNFGDKRRLNPYKRRAAAERIFTSTDDRYVQKSHVQQATGKAAARPQKKNRPDKKLRSRTERRHQKPEVSGTARPYRQNHQLRSHRSAQRGKVVSRSHEQHRAKKEIISRPSQSQAHHPKRHMGARENNNRSNRRPQFRTRGQEPAAVSPPVVRRQPPKVAQTPSVWETKNRSLSISPRRQEQNRRQWRPISGDRRSEANASRHFRGGRGRHQSRN